MIAVLLRALVAVVAAMAATPVHADPISAIALIAQAAAAAGAIAATTATMIAIGAAIVGGILTRQKAKRAAAAARNAQREALQERCAVLQSSEPSPRIIYGRCAVGGDVFDRMSSPRDFFDDNGNAATRPDGWQHVVIGIAHHECQALHRIHINGVWYDITGDGYIDHPDWRKPRRQTVATTVNFVNNTATLPIPAGATASIIDGMSPGLKISGNTITGGGSTSKWIVYQQEVMEYAIRVEWHSGAVGQAASSYLRGLPGSRWTAQHRLNGIAYVVLSLNLDDSRLQGGLPQDLSFDVSGRKVLDPRTGLTAWSDNTALIVHDWLRSEWGYSLQSSDIDTAATIAAANACDVVVGRPTTANASATGPFSRCNGTFRAADDRATVLADLCEQMAGFCAHGETWSIAAGVWSAPVMSLTDDDLAAPIQIQRMATPLDEAFNSARASIIKSGSRDPSDVPPYANASFVAADGEAQWQTFTLPFCADPAAARHLMRVFCEQSRAGQIIQYPARMRAWPLQPGDRVTVTDSMYGMAGLTYRVIERTWAPGQPVLLTLQRDTAATYDSADATSPDPAPATSLPSPGTVDTPSGLVASSGNAELLRRVDGSIVPRVRISWSAPVTMYMTGPGARTEVSMRRVGDDAWQTQTIVGGMTTTTFDGVAEGDLVILRVRHVNSWSVDSPWVLLAHVVVGKTAAPTAPTALSVVEGVNGERIYTVTHTQDIDHAGYIILASGDLSATVSQMVPVATWSGATLQHRSGSPGDGMWRFAGVAVDTSGNWSAPVYVTAPLTRQAIDWVDVGGRPRGYRLITTGGSATVPAPGVGLFDAATGGLVAGVTATQRSYNLAKFNRDTGELVFFKSYDVYANGWGGGVNWQNAAGLTIDLDAALDSEIVVVWTYDEPKTNRLHANLLAAMLRCGASNEVYGSDRVKFRGAYALIGRGGCGAGNGYEAYSGTVDSSPDAWLDVPFSIHSGQVMIGAAGAVRFGSNIYGQAGTGDIADGAATDIVIIPANNVFIQNYGSEVTSFVLPAADRVRRVIVSFDGVANAIVAGSNCEIRYKILMEPAESIVDAASKTKHSGSFSGLPHSISSRLTYEVPAGRQERIYFFVTESVGAVAVSGEMAVEVVKL